MLAASTATPALWDWGIDPPLIIVLDIAFLYWLGSTRTVTPDRTRVAQRRHAAYFYTAMFVLAFALSTPMEQISAKLFWVHMTQHVLLMMVAAPLIVLSRPWVRLWRCLPLGGRRSIARAFVHDGSLAPLARLSRWLGTPIPSLVLFGVVLIGWHTPVMFDATLHSSAVHGLEHTMFLGVAILFWKQVIPSPPLHPIANAWGRVGYIVGGMSVTWALAIVIAFLHHPLYPYYANLHARPGGISALTDQQLAAGVMWVPGSVTFVIVLLVYFVRWLAPAAANPPGAGRLAGEH